MNNFRKKDEITLANCLSIKTYEISISFYVITTFTKIVSQKFSKSWLKIVLWLTKK